MDLHTSILKDLFDGKVFFHTNPMEEFLSNLKNGSFSLIRQKELQLQKQLYSQSIASHFEKIYCEVKDKLDNFNSKSYSLYKRKNSKTIEEIFSDHSSKNDISSIDEISIENNFSDLSQGYTTPDSDPEQYLAHSFSMHKKNESNNNMNMINNNFINSNMNNSNTNLTIVNNEKNNGTSIQIKSTDIRLNEKDTKSIKNEETNSVSSKNIVLNKNNTTIPSNSKLVKDSLFSCHICIYIIDLLKKYHDYRQNFPIHSFLINY